MNYKIEKLYESYDSNKSVEVLSNSNTNKTHYPFLNKCILIITIVPTTDPNDSIDEYSCPVYVLPRRVNNIVPLNNFLGYIDCPTYIGSQYWIMKDVYISCVDPLTNS